MLRILSHLRIVQCMSGSCFVTYLLASQCSFVARPWGGGGGGEGGYGG